MCATMQAFDKAGQLSIPSAVIALNDLAAQIESGTTTDIRVEYLISTPIDDRTPHICHFANGQWVEVLGKPPHDTSDPDNRCQCVVTEMRGRPCEP